MTTSSIRAVVFDFDGLILDTEVPIFAAWCAAFEAHGCELTLDDWAAEIGTVNGIDPLALLRTRALTPVDEAVLHEMRRSLRDELLLAEVARPGVEAWLDEARSLGLGVAIASSSAYDWVDPHLRRLGLRDRFAHLSCYGNGTAAKPAPDTYLEACAALDVRPAQAIAVEDSPHGVAAAKAAGLTCIAVPNAITAQLDLGAADVQLTSLAERSLAQVLQDLAAT
jgi:HAD superfamily hydrolase (TIGR01509 family)